jgi:hypothetical protein
MTKAYSTGLLIDNDVVKTLDVWKIRLHEEKIGTACVIDGADQGMGKTTLAIHMVRYLQDGFIDYENQLATGRTDFIRKFSICVEKGYKAIIYDEAGDFDNSNTREVRDIKQRMQTIRQYEILPILVAPEMENVNFSFLKGICRGVFHIERKFPGKYTVGRIYGRSGIRRYLLTKAQKPYSLPIEIWKKVFHFEQFTPRFRFKDLPADERKKRDRISMDGKDKRNILAGYLSAKDVCIKFKIAKSSLHNRAKKLELKPKKVRNRIYYSTEDIQRMEDMF